MKKPLFITGIGTGVGKTIVSAILAEKLQCDYWKPVQAGDLTLTDSMNVSRLLSNARSVCHPERFKLKIAASPHKAASKEQISINIQDFSLPLTDRELVIEGAGGLLVPLSTELRMINLIEHFQAEAVLVIRDYLGCINHTLLSLEVLRVNKIPVHSIIFSGKVDRHSAKAITHYAPAGINIRQVPELKKINKQTIKNCAAAF